MRASIVRLLRFVSIGVCLVVAASFLTFAVEQTKSASGHQQEQLAATPAESTAAIEANKTGHEGGLHKALDEAASELTSPFASVVSGSSEWATRGIKLVLALLVYGFGLGYLARVLRVRV